MKRNQLCVTFTHLDEHCSPCVRRSHGTEALVTDGRKEDGHRRELRTGDPALVSNGEGEYDEEDGDYKVEVWLEVIPAKVVLCLLNIQASIKAGQERCQRSKVLPGLSKQGELRVKRNTFLKRPP